MCPVCACMCVFSVELCVHTCVRVVCVCVSRKGHKVELLEAAKVPSTEPAVTASGNSSLGSVGRHSLFALLLFYTPEVFGVSIIYFNLIIKPFNDLLCKPPRPIEPQESPFLLFEPIPSARMTVKTQTAETRSVQPDVVPAAQRQQPSLRSSRLGRIWGRPLTSCNNFSHKWHVSKHIDFFFFMIGRIHRKIFCFTEYGTN